MKLKVKEISEKMGIENARQLARVTGLSVTSCYQLWNETAKAISFESLNTLCNVLQAGPALLLDYTPDVEAPAGGAGSQSTVEPKQAKRERRTKGEASKSRKAAPARPAVAMG